ncbi:MAG: hypothetical protein HQM06_02880 [Magnetococcales bacterium]|nr:hypothetical protein [Magnetococcales bacterium]
MLPFSLRRRRFLWQSLLLSLTLSRKGNASEWQQGIRRLQGELLVDGQPAMPGTRIYPGQTVASGADSRTVLVMGQDAFLLGERSKVTFDAANPADERQHSPGLTLHHGRLLSVFGSGKKNLKLPSASIGIRGTGIFLQSEAQEDYLCLCYGKADLHLLGSETYQEFLDSKHHTARWLAAGRPVRPGNLVNHNDEELFMLEALTGRVPSFSDSHY